MTHNFYPHQREGIVLAVRSLQSSGGYYLAWPPGLGKTRSAITIAQILHAERPAVLCPLVVKAVWRNEIAKWGDDPNRWYVNNYDQIIQRSNEHDLIKYAPDLLILDEAHACKSPRSQRSLAVRRIAKNVRWRLLLSGTPSHSPLDWLAQYKIVAPNHPLWSQSFTKYRSKVALLGGPFNNWVRGFDPDGMAEALEATKPYTHAVPKSVLQLPEPIETVVPVTLDEAERANYEKMKKELFVEFADGAVTDAAIVLTKILRLQQITSGFLPVASEIRRFGTTKLDACMDLVEEREGEQIVISCRFTEDINTLKARMGWTTNEDLSLNTWKKPVVITGQENEKSRYWAQRNFQEGKANIAIVQPRAGGVGIDLSAAQTLIYLSEEPSAIVAEQMTGRVWRPGQKGVLQILYLLADKTIDPVIHAGLTARLEHLNLVKLLVRYVQRG